MNLVLPYEIGEVSPARFWLVTEGSLYTQQRPLRHSPRPGECHLPYLRQGRTKSKNTVPHDVLENTVPHGVLEKLQSERDGLTVGTRFGCGYERVPNAPDDLSTPEVRSFEG